MMKYAIITSEGILEIRQDSAKNIPNGGILLSDIQHEKILNAELIIQNGFVISNPNPTNNTIV